MAELNISETQKNIIESVKSGNDLSALYDIKFQLGDEEHIQQFEVLLEKVSIPTYGEVEVGDMIAEIRTDKYGRVTCKIVEIVVGKNFSNGETSIETLTNRCSASGVYKKIKRQTGQGIPSSCSVLSPVFPSLNY